MSIIGNYCPKKSRLRRKKGTSLYKIILCSYLYKSIGEQTMIFDRNEQKEVIALLGAGSMGTAIVRRIGAGKKILLGEHAKFITGTDLLIDGGVIAAIRTGEYQLG